MDQIKYYLKKFSFFERIALKKLLKKVHFSYSNSVKLLSYIYEIKRRENIDTFIIMQNIDLRKITNDPSLSSRQKPELILKKLFEQRYPLTSNYINKDSIQ